MSVHAITTTTTQAFTEPSPIDTTPPNESPDSRLEILSHVESMNNLVQNETNLTLQTFMVALSKMQKTLEAQIQENQSLQNRIIQLETANTENIRLHTAEMRTNTQTITTLSEALDLLTKDLRLLEATATQRKDFEALARNYNAHGHAVGYFRAGGMGQMTSANSGGPSTPYQI